METPRPPYRAALGAFAAVFAVYVATLAPTVTFWDAGEFIAAAKILGVPHPPGTPLFVLLANVWAKLVPVSTFAWRTNLMAATFSAAGAALWFLLIHRALATAPTVFRYAAAAAATALSAFAFTVWQNSNETEVYMVATFTIAAVAWLCGRWRDARGQPRASRLLLLVVFLQAVSIGNHLLALLVGPAVLAFVYHVHRTTPLSSVAAQRLEWAQLLVLAAAWGALMATGLGSATLLGVMGLAYVGVAGYAALRGGRGFAALTLLAVVVGASTYLALYVRAGLSPMINEADPSTFDALLSVIRREQYPPRTPWDDPIYQSGAGNPGRSLGLIGLQLLNYLQYFDWQWARGIAFAAPVMAPGRLPITMLVATLGLIGLRALRDSDRSLFWLLVILFLTTGLGLVAYMNFKPGFALRWDLYPTIDMHEVRERDYFFVVSFLCWGLFAGVGLATVVRWVREWGAPLAHRGGLALYALALGPLLLNWGPASRRHGPDVTLARDFAYDLLQSVEPYAILFTNADNDTFPLWYLQEVEGVRQDVAVVNLSLANTVWYIRQLRDNPVRPFDPTRAPERYASQAPPEPPAPLLALSDAQIDAITPAAISQAMQFSAGPITQVYPRGTPLYVRDQVVLALIQRNLIHRPIYWAETAGRTWLGLDRYLVQHGMAYRLMRQEVQDAPHLERDSPFGVPVDVARTMWLADTVYRYASLFEADTLVLETTAAGIARNLSVPFLSLTNAFYARRERERVTWALRRAVHLAPSADLLSELRFVESRASDSLFVSDASLPSVPAPRD